MIDLLSLFSPPLFFLSPPCASAAATTDPTATSAAAAPAVAPSATTAAAEKITSPGRDRRQHRCALRMAKVTTSGPFFVRISLISSRRTQRAIARVCAYRSRLSNKTPKPHVGWPGYVPPGRSNKVLSCPDPSQKVTVRWVNLPLRRPGEHFKPFSSRIIRD